MKTEIKAYIDNLFEGAPLCRESVDLKEEIMQNCMMKYIIVFLKLHITDRRILERK